MEARVFRGSVEKAHDPCTHGQDQARRASPGMSPPTQFLARGWATDSTVRVQCESVLRLVEGNPRATLLLDPVPMPEATLKSRKAASRTSSTGWCAPHPDTETGTAGWLTEYHDTIE